MYVVCTLTSMKYYGKRLHVEKKQNVTPIDEYNWLQLKLIE